MACILACKLLLSVLEPQFLTKKYRIINDGQSQLKLITGASMSTSIGPFTLQVANSTSLKDAVYRLRYQVYCLETQFENTSEFTDQCERDQFEEQSIHILISHDHNADLVGTVRLIFAQNNDQPFHFEHLCRQRINLPKKIPRTHYAEISRLAVAQKYRNDQSSKSNQALSPSALLYACLMAISDILNIECVCLLEPRLANFFRANGNHLSAIGEAIEHNGIRVPYLFDRHESLKGHSDKSLRLSHQLKTALHQNIVSHPAAKLVNQPPALAPSASLNHE